MGLPQSVSSRWNLRTHIFSREQNTASSLWDCSKLNPKSKSELVLWNYPQTFKKLNLSQRHGETARLAPSTWEVELLRGLQHQLIKNIECFSLLYWYTVYMCSTGICERKWILLLVCVCLFKKTTFCCVNFLKLVHFKNFFLKLKCCAVFSLMSFYRLFLSTPNSDWLSASLLTW